MTDAQLTVQGTEVPVVQHSAGTSALSPVQREILRHLGEHGSIRSFEAGIIVHKHDAAEHAARGFVNNIIEQHRRKYAATDGLAAMKRLEARGLVYKESPGLWKIPA